MHSDNRCMMFLPHELTECKVCSVEFDENTPADVLGYFGIIPVAFCATCTSSMIDMVQQLTGDDEADSE